MAASPISLAFIFLFFFAVIERSQSQSVDFIYNGFNYSTNSYPELKREGASIIKPSGALKLTNRTTNVIGHAFYPDPIKMLHTSLPTRTLYSFSTSFVFSIIPPADSGSGGFGLAFVMSPSTQFPEDATGHYLGIFNSSTDKTSNHIFVVEFDTVNGFDDDADAKGNHVGININNMSSVASQPASYYKNGTDATEEMELEDGKPVRAWIEYDGMKSEVNVTIAPMRMTKPSRPLLSRVIDSSVFTDMMYVGFSASTGEKSSSHYILGWSFRMDGEASELNLPRLPIPPNDKESSSFKPQIKALITALSAIAVFLLGSLFLVTLYRRKMHGEILEEWELDCPHRFKYKDLRAATKGFKESELIGVGGFGEVYKGVLPTNGCEVAVKKISSNSIQGMREFAAEVESLGRLRHKHLVNLQGWCKQKNNLLLIYDYVPHGSLDSLLYTSRNNFVLSWEQRCNILKGIAAGLLYLHEEWEQVVIHRDIKSSNVLIDADMNARLGDFGLARLYDHGEKSHTTNVVGTVGYIAPELARTGKASTSSDVFAYGVLLLEVACGRRPIDSDSQPAGHLILVDWVIECQEMGRILDVVDPKLNSMYVVEEMELVLRLGLLCSHNRQEARPTMRQVTRYLNGDDPLPEIDDWGSLDSRWSGHMTSRFLEVISSDTITTSYRSSSTANLSSTSIEAGR